MIWIPYVIALLILVAVSGFFSGSENAYSSANDLRLKRFWVDNHSQRARRALWISDRYDRALTTILIGNNLVNLASSTIATQLFILLLSDTGRMSENSAAAISTAAITVIVLIFGEIIPKITASDRPERAAMLLSWPLRGIMILLTPLVSLVMNLLGRISKSWVVPEDEDEVTEDDISEMIDTVEDEGVID